MYGVLRWAENLIENVDAKTLAPKIPPRGGESPRNPSTSTPQPSRPRASSNASTRSSPAGPVSAFTEEGDEAFFDSLASAVASGTPIAGVNFERHPKPSIPSAPPSAPTLPTPMTTPTRPHRFGGLGATPLASSPAPVSMRSVPPATLPPPTPKSTPQEDSTLATLASLFATPQTRPVAAASTPVETSPPSATSTPRSSPPTESLLAIFASPPPHPPATTSPPTTPAAVGIHAASVMTAPSLGAEQPPSLPAPGPPAPSPALSQPRPAPPDAASVSQSTTHNVTAPVNEPSPPLLPPQPSEAHAHQSILSTLPVAPSPAPPLPLSSGDVPPPAAVEPSLVPPTDRPAEVVPEVTDSRPTLGTDAAPSVTAPSAGAAVAPVTAAPPADCVESRSHIACAEESALADVPMLPQATPSSACPPPTKPAPLASTVEEASKQVATDFPQTLPPLMATAACQEPQAKQDTTPLRGVERCATSDVPLQSTTDKAEVATSQSPAKAEESLRAVAPDATTAINTPTCKDSESASSDLASSEVVRSTEGNQPSQGSGNIASTPCSDNTVSTSAITSAGTGNASDGIQAARLPQVAMALPPPPPDAHISPRKEQPQPATGLAGFLQAMGAPLRQGASLVASSSTIADVKAAAMAAAADAEARRLRTELTQAQARAARAENSCETKTAAATEAARAAAAVEAEAKRLRTELGQTQSRLSKAEAALAEKTQQYKQAQEQLRALQERCERAELDGQRASSRLELLRTALTAAQQEARTAAQDAEAARASVTQRDAEAAREREAAAQQLRDVQREQRALQAALDADKRETATQLGAWRATLNVLHQREQILEAERAELAQSLACAQHLSDERAHQVDALEQRARTRDAELARAHDELRAYRARAAAVLADRERRLTAVEAALRRARSVATSTTAASTPAIPGDGTVPPASAGVGAGATDHDTMVLSADAAIAGAEWMSEGEATTAGATEAAAAAELVQLRADVARLQAETARLRESARESAEQATAREQRLVADAGELRQRVADAEAALEREKALCSAVTKDAAQRANQVDALRIELAQERARSAAVVAAASAAAASAATLSSSVECAASAATSSASARSSLATSPRVPPLPSARRIGVASSHDGASPSGNAAGADGDGGEAIQLRARVQQLSDELIERQVLADALASEKAALQVVVERLTRAASANSAMTLPMPGGKAPVGLPTPGDRNGPPSSEAYANLISGAMAPFVSTSTSVEGEFRSMQTVLPMFALEHPRLADAIFGNFDAAFQHAIRSLRSSPVLRLSAVLYIVFLQLVVVLFGVLGRRC